MPSGFIRAAAFAVGVDLARRTRDADVLQLLAELRPLDCGKNLIRIGAEGDGGYLLPDDLEGIRYCFSPGVGPIATFENDLADRDIRCFLADYSVTSPPIQRPEFTFDKKYVGANNSEISFSLKSWKDKYLRDYSGELLLQMDIEGSEYEVLLSTPVEVLMNFRIMIIEFHYVNRMFDAFIFRLYKALFEKILQHFHVVHIHPNNCCGSIRKGDIEIPVVMEFTFYNKSRVASTAYQQHFPHPLDRDNVPENPTLPLPRCWYDSR